MASSSSSTSSSSSSSADAGGGGSSGTGGMGKVVLVSAEGDEFEVDRQVASMSLVIKRMLEDADSDDSIPLPVVKTHILKKVITYCEHHYNNPPQEIQQPIKTINFSEIASEWDDRFIRMEQDTLFELILAANYLDIRTLLDLACAKVASMLKGKTPEQIRELFNIVNDFTPEEEAQVREENRWCEDA